MQIHWGIPTSKLQCSTKDKANGNVDFICKWFYALTLMKELRVTVSNNNNIKKTCEMIYTTNENDTIEKNTNFLNRYSLCVN